jgi:hypothetical protein
MQGTGVDVKAGRSRDVLQSSNFLFLFSAEERKSSKWIITDASWFQAINSRYASQYTETVIGRTTLNNEKSIQLGLLGTTENRGQSHDPTLIGLAVNKVAQVQGFLKVFIMPHVVRFYDMLKNRRCMKRHACRQNYRILLAKFLPTSLLGVPAVARADKSCTWRNGYDLNADGEHNRSVNDSSV